MHGGMKDVGGWALLFGECGVCVFGSPWGSMN